ncbi:MAG: P-II family nitrogen regulator [Rhodocyclaceae bacterium]|jgi:nitrogen regulatory protein P-II 1|nr:P-II family nitrogen regulator [Rhodocyclaceae bacterium]
MKEIKAIIRPNKLPQIRNALMALEGFPGMTISQAEGCTAPSRHGAITSIKDELTDFTKKVRLEIVCPDDIADRIVTCITDIAQTGHLGDGIVWVTEVQRAVFVHKTTPGRAPEPRRP